MRLLPFKSNIVLSLGYSIAIRCTNNVAIEMDDGLLSLPPFAASGVWELQLSGSPWHCYCYIVSSVAWMEPVSIKCLGRFASRHYSDHCAPISNMTIVLEEGNLWFRSVVTRRASCLPVHSRVMERLLTRVFTMALPPTTTPLPNDIQLLPCHRKVVQGRFIHRHPHTEHSALSADAILSTWPLFLFTRFIVGGYCFRERDVF